MDKRISALLVEYGDVMVMEKVMRLDWYYATPVTNLEKELRTLILFFGIGRVQDMVYSLVIETSFSKV